MFAITSAAWAMPCMDRRALPFSQEERAAQFDTIGACSKYYICLAIIIYLLRRQAQPASICNLPSMDANVHTTYAHTHSHTHTSPTPYRLFAYRLFLPQWRCAQLFCPIRRHCDVQFAYIRRHAGFVKCNCAIALVRYMVWLRVRNQNATIMHKYM